MIYMLLVRLPITLDGREHPPGALLRVRTLDLAVSLVERARAEPNDATTAEAVELALRVRGATE
jgi:hypothetical protein